MPDIANPNVLDISAAFTATQALGAPLEVLRDIANYGSQLLIRAYPSTSRDLPDTVMVMHLLRLIVTHLDGFHLLLSQAAGPTAVLQLRSIMESALLLEWMNSGDEQTKAKHLAVANWRKRREGAQAFVPGTPKNVDFAAAIPGYSSTPEQQAQANTEIAAIDGVLGQADFSTINQNFDQQRGGRPFDGDWYVVYDWAQKRATGSANPRKFSIRALAESCGKQDEYRYFYSKMSAVAHGADLRGSIAMGASAVSMHNIRRLNDFSWMFSYATTLAVRSYKIILSRYRPGEDSLERRYTNEWRSVIRQSWTVNENAVTTNV